MYTDTHAHLHYIDLSHYHNNADTFLSAVKAAQVDCIMAIMCHFGEYDDIISWVHKSDEAIQIGMSMGVHPCQESDVLRAVRPDDFIKLNADYIWALGETGLDYHWDSNKKLAQKHSFATHIHAGKQLKKPIIVHTRAAYHDTLDILRSEQCEHGIIHCFTEDYAFAKKALDMGLYISFSGIISFKKSVELQEVAKKLPLDRILIETDSPYLAPTPKRGKQNEPTFVPYVAQALAELMGLNGQTIGQITKQNFNNLLNQYQ